MGPIGNFVLQDWHSNRSRPHLAFFLLLFRAAQAARTGPRRLRPLAVLLSAVYRAVGLFAFGIDMPVSSRVGPRLRIHHGFGLVVHPDAMVGADVVFRQGVTIGARTDRDGAPRIGDGVEFGPNAVVLGPVSIGAKATVGACALVTRDVSAGGAVRAPRAV
jgi:serine O-acetyltransferase/putative colanic acid biosynthesis acetyltransferase WcaB